MGGVRHTFSHALGCFFSVFRSPVDIVGPTGGNEGAGLMFRGYISK